MDKAKIAYEAGYKHGLCNLARRNPYSVCSFFHAYYDEGFWDGTRKRRGRDEEIIHSYKQYLRVEGQDTWSRVLRAELCLIFARRCGEESLTESHEGAKWKTIVGQ